jgi:hypothetical protein
MSITQSNKRKTQKRPSQLQTKPSQISSGKSFTTALKAAINKKAATFKYKDKLYTTATLKNKIKKSNNGTSKT